MGLTANVLNILGLVFLSHAYVILRFHRDNVLNKSTSVYSSYEHSLLPSASQPPPQSSMLPSVLDPAINLPIDIVFETIVSVLLLCGGVVLSSPDLKPIKWNVWAGRLERSKEARQIKGFGQGGGNPYAALEERPGFLDIRAKRKEFAAWVKDGGQGDKVQ